MAATLHLHNNCMVPADSLLGVIHQPLQYVAECFVTGRHRYTVSQQAAQLTISGPNPVAYARLAATLLAMRSIGSVTIGQPPQRTSQPVVWALHRGVSKNTSARPLRLMCKSLCATSVKMIRLGSTPCAAACMRMFCSPYGGNRSSHSTLQATTGRRLYHHAVQDR